MPAAVKRRRQARLMRLQKRIVGARADGARRTRVRLLVDGPSAEHELVLRGRLGARRPTSTRSSTSPSATRRRSRPGTFIEAEIVGSRGYDLARPAVAA